MLKADVESVVTCADCGKPAVQREQTVRWPGGERKVVYQTHSESIHEHSHRDALERLDRFHQRPILLQAELNRLDAETLKLEKGSFVAGSFEVATVRPSACARRTEIRPEAMIRAYGQQKDVTLEARPLKGQSVAKILRDLKTAARPIVARMKARFESGDF